MNLAGLILRAAGWHVNITVPPYPRSVICVAPHTSNWDFVLGKLAYASVGRKAGFLMKESWFFFPLGYFSGPWAAYQCHGKAKTDHS